MNENKLLHNFNKNGYLIIRNFLSHKEIKDIFFQLEELIDISLNSLKLKNTRLKHLDEKYLTLLKKNKKLKGHYYDFTKLLDILISKASSKKFVKIAKLLLNSKSVLIDTPQVRCDHYKDKRYLSQHQELNQLSLDVVNFWIPLVNVDEKSGGIFIRPKTHELGFLKYKNSNMSGNDAGHSRQKIIDKLFSRPKYKKYKSICPKLKRGDAVIFHSCIFHGTKPNKIKRMRWTYICRYNSIKTSPYLIDPNSKIRIPYTSDYNLLKKRFNT